MDQAGSLARIGGDVALDFANTAGWHASSERSEHLTSYAEWLRWVRHAELLPQSSVLALGRLEREQPARAAKALAHTVVLRETVYRIFTALAQGGIPAPADLDRLHHARVAALQSAVSTWDKGSLKLRWPEAGSDLFAPLHPLALAASNLLVSPLLERVRQCGNHPCGWLFLDRSKNGSRQWCSSADCGNTTRVRRFRARQAE